MTANTMVQDLEEGEILESEKDCLEKKSCPFYQLGQCRLGKKCSFFHLTGLGLYRMIDSDVPAIPTTGENVPDSSLNIPLRQMSHWDSTVQGYKDYVQPEVITIESDDDKQPSLVQTETLKPLVLDDSSSSSSGSRSISDKNNTKRKHVVGLHNHSKQYSNRLRQSKLTSESSSTSSTNFIPRSKQALTTHFKQRHPKISSKSRRKLAIRQSSSTSSSPVQLYKIRKRCKFQSMRQEKKPRTKAKEYIPPSKSHSFTPKEVAPTPTRLLPRTSKKTSPVAQINAFKTPKKLLLSSYVIAKYDMSISSLTDSSFSDLFDHDKNTFLKNNACHAEVNQLCEFIPKKTCEREVYGPVLAVSSSPKKMKTNLQSVVKKNYEMRSEASGSEPDVYGPVLAGTSCPKTMKMNTWPVVKKICKTGNKAKFSAREIYGPVSAITSSNKKIKTNTYSVVKKNCEKRNKANSSEREVYGPVLAVTSCHKKLRMNTRPVVKNKWEMENEANDSEGEVYGPVLAVRSSRMKMNMRPGVKNNREKENKANDSEQEVYSPVIAAKTQSVTSSPKKAKPGACSEVNSSSKPKQAVKRNLAFLESDLLKFHKHRNISQVTPAQQDMKKSKALKVPTVQQDTEDSGGLKEPSVQQDTEESGALKEPSVQQDTEESGALKGPSVQQDMEERGALKEPSVQQDTEERGVLKEPSVQQDTEEEVLKEPSVQQDMEESRALKEPSVQQDMEESGALKEPSVQQEIKDSKALKELSVQQDTEESRAFKEPFVQHRKIEEKQIGTFSNKKEMLLKQLREINAAIERRLRFSCQELPKK